MSFTLRKANVPDTKMATEATQPISSVLSPRRRSAADCRHPSLRSQSFPDLLLIASGFHPYNQLLTLTILEDHMAEEVRKTMTTDAGRPVGDNQNSLTVGDRGPIVFEDFLLFERWPTSTASGFRSASSMPKVRAHTATLTVTNPDMPKYTTAKLFEKTGKQTPMFLRFSTVGGEKGSADLSAIPAGLR